MGDGVSVGGAGVSVGRDVGDAVGRGVGDAVGCGLGKSDGTGLGEGVDNGGCAGLVQAFISKEMSIKRSAMLRIRRL